MDLILAYEKDEYSRIYISCPIIIHYTFVVRRVFSIIRKRAQEEYDYKTEPEYLLYWKNRRCKIDYKLNKISETTATRSQRKFRVYI